MYQLVSEKHQFHILLEKRLHGLFRHEAPSSDGGGISDHVCLDASVGLKIVIQKIAYLRELVQSALLSLLRSQADSLREVSAAASPAATGATVFAVLLIS